MKTRRRYLYYTTECGQGAEKSRKEASPTRPVHLERRAGNPLASSLPDRGVRDNTLSATGFVLSSEDAVIFWATLGDKSVHFKKYFLK